MTELDDKMKILELEMKLMKSEMDNKIESLSASNKELKEQNEELKDVVRVARERPAPRTITSLGANDRNPGDPLEGVSPAELIVAAEKAGITLKEIFPL